MFFTNCTQIRHLRGNYLRNDNVVNLRQIIEIVLLYEFNYKIITVDYLTNIFTTLNDDKDYPLRY